MPTGLAARPWERGNQNGIGLNGLLVHLIETIPAPVAMTTERGAFAWSHQTLFVTPSA